jgi:uncharacterized SAM-binding protein YcdF (DUF218 family)
MLVGSWTGYQWYDIQRTWRNAVPAPADAAIILGAGVWNGKPSPALRERLDVALRLEQAALVGKFVCTGGVGEDPRSEASVCSEYLQVHGVPAERIVMEERSTSTLGNLQNGKEVMDQRGLNTALLVTHGFHLKRALIQASDLGLKVTGAPVTVRPLNEMYLILREVAAITYYHLGGRERVGLFRWSVIDR